MRVCEIENLALRVPYVFGKDHIGGYLGHPELRNANDKRLSRASRLLDILHVVPMLVCTSKTMYGVRDYLPKFALLKVVDPCTGLVFAYDHLSSIEDAREWISTTNDVKYLVDSRQDTIKMIRMHPNYIVRDVSFPTCLGRDLLDHSILLTELLKEQHAVAETARYLVLETKIRLK